MTDLEETKPVAEARKTYVTLTLEGAVTPAGIVELLGEAAERVTSLRVSDRDYPYFD